MRTEKPTAQHAAFYQEFALLLKKHCAEMTPAEMLAVASQAVGKIVALQDQRVTTPEQAMKIVSLNLQAGNQMMVRELMGETKGRA